ncbi:MAG: cell wall anchor protein [Muribaculaceae bacterium]|nr:cell wall anchor protein [Muribaculaceae bacterium]
MFRTLLLNTTLAATALAALPATASAQTVSVTSSLDSAYILMGKQTAIHLQVVQDATVAGAWAEADAKNLTPEVYVIKATDADTTDLGNNRMQIDRNLIIQAFDSGLYTLPPLNYVVNSDTFRTNPLALKVIPVDIDTMTSIHGYAGTVSITRKFWDYFPDFIADYWQWYVLALVIAGGVIAYLLLRKKGIKAVFTPVEKPVPPYEAAMAQLERLRLRKLCERGQEKEFYTELTDILRVYLHRRFGINAMEMTTTQIKRAIRENDTTRSSTGLMTRILEMADFVKFAKVRPLPEDNTSSFNSAVTFIEDTRPQPEPEANDTGSDNAATKSPDKP